MMLGGDASALTAEVPKLIPLVFARKLSCSTYPNAPNPPNPNPPPNPQVENPNCEMHPPPN